MSGIAGEQGSLGWQKALLNEKIEVNRCSGSCFKLI